MISNNVELADAVAEIFQRVMPDAGIWIRKTGYLGSKDPSFTFTFFKDRKDWVNSIDRNDPIYSTFMFEGVAADGSVPDKIKLDRLQGRFVTKNGSPVKDFKYRSLSGKAEAVLGRFEKYLKEVKAWFDSAEGKEFLAGYNEYIPRINKK